MPVAPPKLLATCLDEISDSESEEALVPVGPAIENLDSLPEMARIGRALLNPRLHRRHLPALGSDLEWLLRASLGPALIEQSGIGRAIVRFL